MAKLKDLKARFMEGPAFREESARIDGEHALVEALVRACTVAKPTQAELAGRLGTTRSAVARLAGRAGVPVPCHPAARRRGDGDAADRGPGAGRRLNPRDAGLPAAEGGGGHGPRGRFHMRDSRMGALGAAGSVPSGRGFSLGRRMTPWPGRRQFRCLPPGTGGGRCPASAVTHGTNEPEQAQPFRRSGMATIVGCGERCGDGGSVIGADRAVARAAMRPGAPRRHDPDAV